MMVKNSEKNPRRGPGRFLFLCYPSGVTFLAVDEQILSPPWGQNEGMRKFMICSDNGRVKILRRRWLSALLLPWLSGAAQAHPHSFIDMRTEIVSDDTRLTGLKMTWTMDEITSADVFYDAGDAKPNSEIWKKLAAEVMANVLSQHYFTEAYRDGQPLRFADRPAEYHLSRNGLKATLAFVMPLAHPPALSGSPCNVIKFINRACERTANRGLVDHGFAAVVDCGGDRRRDGVLAGYFPAQRSMAKAASPANGRADPTGAP